jgi:hypothetical protein
MKKYLNWKYLLFALVILVAIGFRTYNFSDWLIVKSDQIRDAIMVSRSFHSGLEELPLLGPRAAGSVLRLGPIFYYFQYLSAVLSGNELPPNLAYANLIFSILTIPLLYLFLRKYFDRDRSMLITALFSFSYVAVEYSRFTWNPNSIPFFSILYIYSLLNLINPENKRKMLWIVLASISLAVATQLHFTSFIGLPLITIAVFILKFKSFKNSLNWKRIAVFLSIFALIYLPVILSDVVNKGDNAHLFMLSVQKKSSDNPLGFQVYKDAFYFGKYFMRFLLGYIEYNHWLFLIFSSLIGLGVFSNVMLWLKEKDPQRKNFLLFSLTWFIVSFLLYISLATKIDKPRFFLPLMALPFIQVGLIYEFSKKWIQEKTAAILFTLIILLAMASNLYFVLNWLKELGDAQKIPIDPQKTVVLKAKGDPAWWTWKHFTDTASYISQDCKKSDIYYLMPKKTEEYTHQVEYAIQKSGEQRPIHIMAHKIDYNPDGCYYFISKTNAKITEEVVSNLNILDSKSFGDLAITTFAFPIGRTETVDLDKKKIKASSDISSDETASDSETENTDENPAANESTASEDQKKALDKQLNQRKPRIYWKDVFTYFK